MRLSIWPGIERPYAEIVEMSQHAASTGWDGVYLADHFMPNDVLDTQPMLECGSLIAALGAQVPRVRIGTLVYGVTYRHPAVLANMAATVDHITGGRFVLGVGAGWQLNEHAQYGIELGTIGQRIDRFVESLHVLRGLLRESRYSYSGSYYRITDAVCEPKPLQDPMPILIGAKGERRMLRVVAEHADIWNAWGRPDLIAHKSAVIDRYCAEIGRDPASIERTAQALVVLNGSMPPGDGHPPMIGGSPERLAETIAHYREIGLHELIIPDDTLGSGSELLKAMDTILSLR